MITCIVNYLCRTEHRKDPAQLQSNEYLGLLGSEVDDFFEKELHTSHTSLSQSHDELIISNGLAVTDPLSAKSLDNYNPQVILFFHV